MVNEIRDHQGYPQFPSDCPRFRDINPVLPTVYTTVYHIEWVWLVMPAVLELSANCVLTGTMTTTRGAKLQVWRESVIAIMFRDV